MASETVESKKNYLPTINLLCRFKSNSKAWEDAVQEHLPNLHEYTDVHIYNCPLAALPADVRYDAVVSPANSYGFMDGAFDDAISVALSPNRREGYPWTTKKVQQALYDKWKGYAPPGSCTMIDVRRDSAWYEIKRAEKSSIISTIAALGASKEHKGGCKYIALCPTMRIPQVVTWDREVVFECIWALLCALDAHNREVQDPELQIKSILMTPLATGVGKVSEAKWATQCVLAIKYWLEAVEQPEKWSNLQWQDIGPPTDTLESTQSL